MAQFKLVNESQDDYSKDVLLQAMILLEIVYAGELICYKIARDLKLGGYVDSLFQTKKKALKSALDKIEKANAELRYAFDEKFDKIVNKIPGEESFAYKYIQKNANDILQLLLIYFARGDGDQAKKDSMKKALMNFKPNPDYNLEGILQYYNFK